MTRKRLVLPVVAIVLLLLAFWLGRISSHGHGDDKESRYQEVSKPGAEPKPDESVPHGHEEGKADQHEGGKEESSGLKLSPEEMQNIGLKTVAADLRPIETVIRTTGIVKPHPDREAQVSSRVSGKIVGLTARVGDAVRKGQWLAEVQSAEIQKLQVDLMQAENKLILAKADLERMQMLFESKIAAKKDLIAAQNQHQTVLNEIGGLRQQLIFLGLPESAVRQAQVEKSVSTLPIVAPLNGVVAERSIMLGETVEPSKVIFKILDLSIVSVEGNAFEEALPKLKIGQTVRIRLASYSGDVFTGKILRFSPTLDPQKRTVQLWAEVVNPAGKLKPNLFAEMDVVVGGSGEVLAIPLAALIKTEGETFVFVEEKGSFRRADVILGGKDDRYVEVKKGLLPGERVVTDGKQQIYTKSLMARQGGAVLGGHTH
jgi:cobalt-zinc-cadmium efflux system membrane fusion protein